MGNTNRRAESDSEEQGSGSDKDEGEEGEEEEEEEEEDKDPFAISDDSEEEEQMAAIRAKILNSKSFQNPSASDKPQPEKIARPEEEGAKSRPLEDSDAESGSAEGSEDEAFDSIINATPVTDRTGIIAAQKKKEKETFSASFSRTVVDAPKRW